MSFSWQHLGILRELRFPGFYPLANRGSKLLEAWTELPESVKDAIRALVLRSLGEAEWRWSGVSGLRCKFWPHGRLTDEG